MVSVLSLILFSFIIGYCPLVTGGPTSHQCSDRNLAIQGGRLTLSKMYNDGSVLKYHCPEGYYPHPVVIRKCFRGQWDPAPSRKQPQCKRVTCPNPNVLKNGVVDPYKKIYYVNDTTTYRCNSDYTFRGSSTRVCQANGKWSGGTPICSRNYDHCPDPGTPPGASRTGHIFNIDDTVTYRCNNKLMLLGSKIRVCQDDGQWSGQEPECYAVFTYDTPEEVAEAFSSSLQTTLIMHEETGKEGKRIKLEQGGKLDIYIALDASDSIDENDFNEAKSIIKQLIEKIRYYQVSPNYEIIIFATEVTRIVSIADYKRNDDEKLDKVLRDLEGFNYDAKGIKTGTDISKAYGAILESISFEKTRNPKAFNDIHHVIIMFTDGLYNIGGNPIHNIRAIQDEVFYDQMEKRDEYLDLYVFGVGNEVLKEDIDGWVTKRRDEKHFYSLRNIENVQETFDQMIDESTSVSLCGLYRDYDDGTPSSMRRRYPWLIKIDVTHEDGKISNCLGSLVTPKFILTAAHCFRIDDKSEKIKVEAPNARDILPKVKEYIPHPKFKVRGKVKEGISEFYEYDVALIELERSVIVDINLRTICIPCTKETSGALRLSSSGVTCKHHKEELMNNDLVNANFMSAKKANDDILPKKKVQIKQGHKRAACIEDAKKELKLTNANRIITDNFLCTGGIEQNHIDDISCKGDSGGATFVEQKSRVIQVGIISWGLKDICTDKTQSVETARDFHTNLFSPEVQAFLKQYLGDGKRGAPLTFL
ncbi:complement factor B-like isoform X2 [Brachyhypopomus gauderio]|uniref:complement factor B-like isoform X2 n=1 Tax=Brachyhypopomus gauderio TaxID=698409 RepID=UPI004042A4E5